MKSLKYKSTSLFGSCPEIFRRRIAHWKNRNELSNFSILVIDDKDGRLAMCPLRLNKQTTVYESNEDYINGGRLNMPIRNLADDKIIYKKKTCIGLNDRIMMENLEDYADINIKNFYETDINQKYGFVAASKSLDREENKHITIEDKINKLKESVADGGYLYIEYYIALDNNDYEKYPKNQYPRCKEMKEYFNSDEWSILSNIEYSTKEEKTKMNLEDKNIIFGIIDVRKGIKKVIKKPRKIHNISAIKRPLTRKTKNYSINGVIR